MKITTQKKNQSVEKNNSFFDPFFGFISGTFLKSFQNTYNNNVNADVDDNDMIIDNYGHDDDNNMLIDFHGHNGYNDTMVKIAENDECKIICDDGKKDTVFPIFLNESIIHLHSKFNQQFSDSKMSHTSFWKNIPNYFLKNGKKRTDLCHICEHGKNALKMRKICNEPKILQQVINFYILN